MEGTNELLKLIEDKNAVKILSEENLIEKLDALHELDLIDTVGNAVILTEKGKRARLSGISRLLKGKTKGCMPAGKSTSQINWISREWYALMFLLALLIFTGFLTIL